MLSINQTVKIDGVKYKIESIRDGYLVTSNENQFIIYQHGNRWCTADDISLALVMKLGEAIEDLIWFMANGV